MRLLLCLFFTCTLYAAGVNERLGLDPIARGIWTLHGEWDNSNGADETVLKDWTLYDDPAEYAHAKALTVKIFSSPPITCTIDTVTIAEEADGTPYNVVILENGTVWTMHKTAGNRFFKLKVWDAEGKTCTSSYLFTVDN